MTLRPASVEPVGALIALLRPRRQVTLSYLACQLGVTTAQLAALLDAPKARTFLKKNAWAVTDSAALRLPPLLHGPPVPMLARQLD